MSLVSEDCFLRYQMCDWSCDKMLICSSIWGQWLCNSRNGKKQQGNIFLDQEASKTGMVQRFLLLARPGPLNCSLSDLSMESLLNLRKPSQHCGTQWAWNAPKAWSNMWLCRDPADWKLAPASCLYKDCNMTTANCWPSTTPERSSGRRSEIRHSALGRTQKNQPSDCQMFSGKDFMRPNSDLFSYPEEH